jgi:hypothetical protein
LALVSFTCTAPIIRGGSSISPAQDLLWLRLAGGRAFLHHSLVVLRNPGGNTKYVVSFRQDNAMIVMKRLAENGWTLVHNVRRAKDGERRSDTNSLFFIDDRTVFSALKRYAWAVKEPQEGAPNIKTGRPDLR